VPELKSWKPKDSTIKETLQEHPDYPSALFLCDALTEWKIDNQGVRLTLEDLQKNQFAGHNLYPWWRWRTFYHLV